MSKRFIFQTGHGKGLAKTEILALFPDSIIDEVKDGLVCEIENIQDIKLIQNRMGGIVRIGEVLRDGPAHMPLNFEQWLTEALLEEKVIQDKSGKFRYGLSIHPKTDRILKSSLIGSKKALKKEGCSIRFINKDFQNLSSVQAWHEGMLKDNAAEYQLFKSEENSEKQRWYLCKTLTIQNFEWYSKRDYDRPAKSAKNGMFPPKLAQILINLATEGNESPVIYDPFCGSGTLIQEAWLMGYKTQGSDLSQQMVEDSDTNHEWLQDLHQKRSEKHRHSVNPNEPKLFKADATQLKADDLPDEPFVIVTETWLGPILTKCPSPIELPKVQREIEAIYEGFFSTLKEQFQIWKKDHQKDDQKLRIVFTAPYHREGNVRHFLPNLPMILNKHTQVLPLSEHERPTLFFERKSQIVSREIWKVEIS